MSHRMGDQHHSFWTGYANCPDRSRFLREKLDEFLSWDDTDERTLAGSWIFEAVDGSSNKNLPAENKHSLLLDLFTKIYGEPEEKIQRMLKGRFDDQPEDHPR